MSALWRCYLRTHEAVERNPGPSLALFAASSLVAMSGLTWIGLDMSFRPLFASGAEIAQPTEEFEAVFGQSSGAWISVILESDGRPTPELVRITAELSSLAEDIPHVSEVQSLTTVQVPEWQQNSLRLVSPIPDALYEEETLLADRYESLLDGGPFPGWLVSADGRRLLVSARLDLPLDDLAGRRSVAREFRELVLGQSPPGIGLHFTGVSIVELAYADLVVRDQLLATSLTSMALVILLFWVFGTYKAVAVCMVPVSIAVPATLGLMGWMGQTVTIINSVIPAVILVIGVADAVHMLTAWLESRGEGASRTAASQTMIETTGTACFFTTVTTMSGFLALLSARLDAIGDFGVSVAVGLLFVWLANQLLIPWMLRRIDAGTRLPGGVANRLADLVIGRSMRIAFARPWRIVIAGSAILLLCLALIPMLDVDQRFNKEVAPGHPLREAQRIMEQDFGGFLGPEISIKRREGGSLLSDAALDDLSDFTEALRAIPETRRVWSVEDLLPERMDPDQASVVLGALRKEKTTAQRAHELISPSGDELAVIVRTGDMGTHRAGRFREEILTLAEAHWGRDFEIGVVGQWWLAQHGMRLLLGDMLRSIASAMLIVLPLLWLALRKRRLFITAAMINIAPLAVPLAFMAATGIAFRIGTAVVLAIALGIAVDNTLHLIIRLRERLAVDESLEDQITTMMSGSGRAVIFTTLILMGGFLSMASNQLLAIRDMGIVAAVTFLGAALTDLLLLPALFILMRPQQFPKNRP